MRMRKLVLDLSLAQIFPEKINQIFFLNNLGFIDVLSTVCLIVMPIGTVQMEHCATKAIQML